MTGLDTMLRCLALLASLTLSGCVSTAPAEAPPAGDEALVADTVPDGPATPEPAPPLAPSAQARPPEVFHLHGNTTAGTHGRNDLGDPRPALRFNVTLNVTAIAIELVWDDDVDDLDAMTWPNGVPLCENGTFGDPFSMGDSWVCTLDDISGYSGLQNTDGNPGDGDSPSRLLVDRPVIEDLMAECGEDPCLWLAYAWARNPVVDVEWDLTVTVLYGEVPAEFASYPLAPWDR